MFIEPSFAVQHNTRKFVRDLGLNVRRIRLQILALLLAPTTLDIACRYSASTAPLCLDLG